MWMTIVFLSVASASSGRGKHMSLEGLMLEGSGHMLDFTLMVIVSAGVGQEEPGSSGCRVRWVAEGVGALGFCSTTMMMVGCRMDQLPMVDRSGILLPGKSVRILQQRAAIREHIHGHHSTVLGNVPMKLYRFGLVQPG